MNKSLKIYLVLLVIVVGFLTFLQLNKSTLIDWRKTFDINQTQPFGLYIFNQEIEVLLGAQVQKTTESPYDFYTQDSIQGAHNILLVNQDVTPEGLVKILEQVKQGSNLIYIGENQLYNLSDSLHFDYDYTYYEHKLLSLLDQQYKADSIYIEKIPSRLSIRAIDTATTQLLGVNVAEASEYQEEKTANFIAVQYGKGKVYIHTEPMFLTNYYLLNKDDYRYAEDVFSYLPLRKTIWFISSDQEVSNSPLRFVLQSPPLRYAWYLMLLGLLLFILFNAKRRQRIVPIIEPYKNRSVDFVKTIGNLYLQEGNYKDMAHKKAIYFLNKVRTDLLIDTHPLDEVFWRRIKLKTGTSDQVIQQVIPLLEKALHPKAPVQESELIQLNQLLNQIYN